MNIAMKLHISLVVPFCPNWFFGVNLLIIIACLNTTVLAFELVEFQSKVLPPTPFQERIAKKKGIDLILKSGIIVEGRLEKPTTNGPYRAVVLLHGCGGIWEWDDVWMKRLVSWGYLVLNVDSLSSRAINSVCQRAEVSAIACALDAYGARVISSRKF